MSWAKRKIQSDFIVMVFDFDLKIVKIFLLFLQGTEEQIVLFMS